MSKHTVILASGSPRRRALVSPLDISLTVLPVDIDESPLAGEHPAVYAERLAREKAEAAQKSNPDAIVLGGDTIVTLDGVILGKPADAEHAQEMLQTLSDREHAVISGWAVIAPDGSIDSGTDTAWVRFDSLSDEQIKSYVDTGEPMDKAGAYGIQGHGGELVASYRGDFSTIVGFPMKPILRCLGKLGVVPDSDLYRRYANVMGRVTVAALESGRSPENIRVIAASKAQDSEVIRALYGYGHRDFGESYVQELVAKTAALPEDIDWTFIGRLQRNKVRQVLPHVRSIQTIASVKLAEAVSSKALTSQCTMECLVQVNLAGEETKSGVLPDELPHILEVIASLPNLKVVGLMCLPPRSGLADARGWFRRLRDLRDRVCSEALPLKELSMGMSSDFDGAIMEGATIVRVGTALFGQRPSP